MSEGQKEGSKSPTPSDMPQQNSNNSSRASNHSKEDGKTSRRSSNSSKASSRASRKMSEPKETDDHISPQQSPRSGHESDQSEQSEQSRKSARSVKSARSSRKMSKESINSRVSDHSAKGDNSRRSSLKSNRSGDQSPRMSKHSQSSRKSQRKLSVESLEGTGRGSLKKTSSLPDITNKMRKITRSLQNSPKPPIFYPHSVAIQIAAKTTMYNGFFGNGKMRTFQHQSLQAMKEEQIQRLMKSIKHTAKNQRERLERARSLPRSSEYKSRSQPRSLDDNEVISYNTVERFGEPQEWIRGRTRKWKPKYPERQNQETQSLSNGEDRVRSQALQRKALKNTLFHCEKIVSGQHPADLDGRIPNCLRCPVNYGQQPRVHSCQYAPWGSVSLLNKHSVVSTYLPHPKGDSAVATRPLSAPSKLQSLHQYDDSGTLPVTPEAEDFIEADAEEDANNNGEYYYKYNESSSPRVSFAEVTDDTETPRAARSSDRPKSARRRSSTIPDDAYADDVAEFSDGSTLDDETEAKTIEEEPEEIVEETEQDERDEPVQLDDNVSVADSVYSFKSAASEVQESDNEKPVSHFMKKGKSKRKQRKSSQASRKESSDSKDSDSSEEELEHRQAKNEDANETEKDSETKSNGSKDARSIKSGSSRTQTPQAHFSYPDKDADAVENDHDDGQNERLSEHSDSNIYSEDESIKSSDSSHNGEKKEDETLNATFEKKSSTASLNATYEKKYEEDKVFGKNSDTGNQSEDDYANSIEADQNYQSDSSDEENDDSKTAKNKESNSIRSRKSSTSQRGEDKAEQPSRRSSKASHADVSGSRNSVSRSRDEIDGQAVLRGSTVSHPGSRASKLSAKPYQSGNGSRRDSRASSSSKTVDAINGRRDSKSSRVSVASGHNSHHSPESTSGRMSNASQKPGSNGNLSHSSIRRSEGDNQSVMSQMSYPAGGHDDIPDVIRPPDSRRSSRMSRASISRKSISPTKEPELA